MDYNLASYLILSALVLGIGVWTASRSRSPFPARLLVAALGLRIFGSLVRYEILERYYNGVGDAGGYYQFGLTFARRLWSGDLSVLGYHQWFTREIGGGPGTQFLKNVSGLVVSVVGPSMRAEFLAFSLLSFLGLYLIAVGFARTTSTERGRRLAAFMWLWPSLWFWPSSVGKEAILLLALGICVLGLAGFKGRYRGLLLGLGLAIMFMLRAHVAFLFIAAAGTAHWLASWTRINTRRVLEGALIAIAVLFLFQAMSARLGIGDADLEGISEFMARASAQTMQGGGSIGDAPSGLLAVPMAFVNVWMRPFPWEAHNITALFASLELLLFWYLLWHYRGVVRTSLGRWRRNRFTAFVVVFLLGYTLMIGLTFANLGIIARQRAPVFAFFFMLPAGAATTAFVRVSRRNPASLEPLSAARD